MNRVSVCLLQVIAGVAHVIFLVSDMGVAAVATKNAAAGAIRAVAVISGFNEPIDMMFLPPAAGEAKVQALVLEKRGRVLLVDLKAGTSAAVGSVKVATASEEGLLAGALHPEFISNRKVYLYFIEPGSGQNRSVLAEFTLAARPPKAGKDPGTVRLEAGARLLEIPQPYSNHNGGKVLFGRDGFLYLSLGDGGSGGDPQGHGQNPGTLLGSILRIDVNRRDPGKAYGIPVDNPFVKSGGGLPEVWAYGLRNPWRFSLASDNALIIGDVGQNRQEEISVARAGDNLGWNVMEGALCFRPAQGCDRSRYVQPSFVYGRDQGVSVVGGLVYRGTALPALKGQYLFADFYTGNIWSMPEPRRDTPAPQGEVRLLLKTEFNPVSFAEDTQGEVYVLGMGDGRIHRLSGK